MTNLKNFGTRTLVGNWFEERVTLESHFAQRGTTISPRDMTVDVHISAKDECPKMDLSMPFEKETSYTFDTHPRRIEERNAIKRKIDTANQRRRLTGTRSIAQASHPGTTATPTYLSRQFIDPNKTRFKTTYLKSYNRPEFEATRGLSTYQQTRDKPRMTQLDTTWTPI